MANKYEHRALLFLDILGFKRLIDQKRDDLVEEALSVTSAQYQSNYEISAFSDNMAVSMRFERGYELLELIHFASYLAWHLLYKGVLSRGGIAVGELYHQNGIVYGPALLTAYQLESQAATYPRIVLERDAIEKSLEIGGNPQGCEEGIRAQLRTDFDGWQHIHLNGPCSDDAVSANAISGGNENCWPSQPSGTLRGKSYGSETGARKQPAN